MILHIKGDTITTIYDERLDLSDLGAVSIRRASNVEPDQDGQWTASMAPVLGPVLGPFPKRSQALSAEVAWLENNLKEVAIEQNTKKN